MVSNRTRVFFRKLRNFFFTTVIGGIVVVLPISLFIVLIRFIIRFTTRLLAPIKELLKFSTDVNEWIIYLIAFGIVIFAFFLIGLFVRTRFGKRLFTNLEKKWLSPLPLYDTLRETVQQFAGQKKMPFSRVVLVDVFGTPTRMTGFVTEELDEDLFTVFVPTGPNPTNGFIFHVKKAQLEFLDIRPEDAMRTIIGVGTGSGILFGKE